MKLRSLTGLFCFVFFITTGCNTAAAPLSKGTLYLENSIAGGLRLYWLYLGDDGTFVKDPKFGVDPVNYTLEKQNNSLNVGTYKKTHDMIMVTYANGKTETWKIEYLNGTLNTIDGLYASIESPLPSNFKLNGSFTANLYTTSIASTQTYTFNNDGNVTLTGLGAIRNDATNATASSQKRGTYFIKGNTISINFTNEQPLRAVIGFLPGTKPSVIINETLFK